MKQLLCLIILALSAGTAYSQPVPHLQERPGKPPYQEAPETFDSRLAAERLMGTRINKLRPEVRERVVSRIQQRLEALPADRKAHLHARLWGSRKHLQGGPGRNRPEQGGKPAAPALFIPAASVHEVPFGSSGNTLDLALSGLSDADTLQFSVREAPEWLAVQIAGPPSAATGSGQSARLSLSVEPLAPVGEPAALLVDIRSTSGSAWTKEVRIQVSAPAELALHPAFPNPFTSHATIRYTLPAESEVELAVYDLLGRRVSLLSKGRQKPGTHTAVLDGTPLASGMYVCRLQASGRVLTSKVLHVR